MSVVIVLIFVAMIMGIGIMRNRKISVKSGLPLSRRDKKRLVLN